MVIWIPISTAWTHQFHPYMCCWFIRQKMPTNSSASFFIQFYLRLWTHVAVVAWLGNDKTKASIDALFVGCFLLISTVAFEDWWMDVGCWGFLDDSRAFSLRLGESLPAGQALWFSLFSVCTVNICQLFQLFATVLRVEVSCFVSLFSHPDVVNTIRNTIPIRVFELWVLQGRFLIAHWTMASFGWCMSFPYGNIYHQYTPNVSIYTSTMDPMSLGLLLV